MKNIVLIFAAIVLLLGCVPESAPGETHRPAATEVFGGMGGAIDTEFGASLGGMGGDYWGPWECKELSGNGHQCWRYPADVSLLRDAPDQ